LTVPSEPPTSSPEPASRITATTLGKLRAEIEAELERDEPTVAPINPPLTSEVTARIEAKLVREHPYMAERGLTPETVTAFGLGYYPPGRGMMQNRLCIPIHNATGELVAYMGRWVGPEATIPENEGKYKLPPGFQKEQVLYNLHRVRGRRHLVVVEGPFSVFRLHALGVPAVALLGHRLAPVQLELLVAAGVRQLTFLLDGDPGGREAVPAMMALLAAMPLLAKFAVLPEGVQPDTTSEETLRALLGRG
jgi:DNA primase